MSETNEPFQITIPGPKPDHPTEISLPVGSSLVFVGANGSGKTRLAVFIESHFGKNAHRISAHRSLSLNPEVTKTTIDKSFIQLTCGVTDPNLGKEETSWKMFRKGNRWHNHPETALLNDFDPLIQCLYAEQNKTTLITHKAVNAGRNPKKSYTKFERLEQIWKKLLPNCKLNITGDDIKVIANDANTEYSASQMSDGERAVFYLIGQVLVAAPDSILVFDEPELHVHRSIMTKFWDELESIRPDCAFILITHDLEFAASRVAQKYVIQSYNTRHPNTPNAPDPYWVLETIPEGTGFSEELTTLILGTRQPVLFVEGKTDSLDTVLYQSCFPEFTVIAGGSCEGVIRSVKSLKENAGFTRIKVFGLVDADSRTSTEIEALEKNNIFVLPVSEIENLFLLPEVSRTILKKEGYSGEELEGKLTAVATAVFDTAKKFDEIDKAVGRHCRRRIDNALKGISFEDAKTGDEVIAAYKKAISALDVDEIAQTARTAIEVAITNRDLNGLLATYDNKGLLNIAASHLRSTKVDAFKRWLIRQLQTGSSEIAQAVKTVLPKIPVPQDDEKAAEKKITLPAA